ncbi:LOW QUALITY PROTEIN: regulator of microtubule dynamics protein 1 [Melanerpes formicivorus]|uniref:LOW QUALITY PROTEIN: regulator of microtubule dynamics protein 1 n=1 Tax=Melanerpes formicivorus TaxID=211600 RepID=UPI00358F52CE
MAARVLVRSFRRGTACLGRSLRREAGGSPWCWRDLGRTSVLRKSLQGGVALSTGSFLVYGAHKLFSGLGEVHASFKVEEVIEQADYLYGSGETEKLYQLLFSIKTAMMQSCYGGWHGRHGTWLSSVALLQRKKGNWPMKPLSMQNRHLKKMNPILQHTRKQELVKCVREHEKEWYGICLSDVGDFEGIKTKIGNAIIIKEHFQRAIELNPKDATTIHLIGIWCYSFAEMPWYQRKIAATLFATPPTSTFQEALHYFHMAEEADPNFYSKNLLFLGKTYLKLNNKKLALLWLSKAKDYPAHTEEDKQVQKEALELLNSI